MFLRSLPVLPLLVFISDVGSTNDFIVEKRHGHPTASIRSVCVLCTGACVYAPVACYGLCVRVRADIPGNDISQEPQEKTPAACEVFICAMRMSCMQMNVMHARMCICDAW